MTEKGELHMGRHREETTRRERIRVRVTKEEKDALREYCSSIGYDVSGYIRALIEQDRKEGSLCKS